MTNVIVDLDDQPSETTHPRAHAFVIGGLLVASAAFASAVWFGGTADVRGVAVPTLSPPAQLTPTLAVPTPVPTAFKATVSTVRVGTGLVVIYRRDPEIVEFHYLSSPDDAIGWMDIH